MAQLGKNNASENSGDHLVTDDGYDPLRSNL